MRGEKELNIMRFDEGESPEFIRIILMHGSKLKDFRMQK